MRIFVRRWAIWSCLVLALASASRATAAGNESDNPAITQSVKPFHLGDMLKPFTPPPLAELDKSAGWYDEPVLSGMEVMRKKQEAAGPPPLSIAEARALRNDSPENNKKILDTLGRLAPADGAGVYYDSVLVRHAGGDLKSSNPLLISSITEFEYQQLTGFGSGNGLVTYDQDLKNFAQKEWVVSWQTSKDHKMDKFVLRDDLTWSDGKPITAYDVEFSFKAIMSEAVPVLSVRTGTDQIKYVHAYDDHTLVIFHKEALATNVVNMTFPIIPRHVYEKSLGEDPTMARTAYHTKLEDKPVVAGPFELVSRVRTQEFVVRRRDSYYMHNGKQVRPKPYFREVRVKTIEDFNTALLALKAGQIDEMELRAEQWKTQTEGDDFYKRDTKVYATEWTEFHIDWNCKSPFFSDKRVRQAMSWAFDYDEFLKKITYDMYQPCQGMNHPTSWAFPKNGPQPYHQDLDKAEDLLDQAGWTDSDGDGIRDKEVNGRRMTFEFTLLTGQTETAMQCATLMKECLGKIGIICNVKPTEFTVLMDSEQHHKFEAAFGGWGSSPDPDAHSNIYVTGENRNYGSYSNKRVDELFEKGRREFDPEKRAAIYGEIHNIAWEDQPCTWLFYRNAFYAFNKNVLGYNFCPTSPFLFSPGFDSIYKPAAVAP
jgi:peptide/nickel transport system substrate-binding protein